MVFSYAEYDVDPGVYWDGSKLVYTGTGGLIYKGLGSGSSSTSRSTSSSSESYSSDSSNVYYYRQPTYEFNPVRQEDGYSVSGPGNYYR
jgi:hypothetical protein